jgi:hypothetical protein
LVEGEGGPDLEDEDLAGVLGELLEGGGEVGGVDGGCGGVGGGEEAGASAAGGGVVA